MLADHWLMRNLTWGYAHSNNWNMGSWNTYICMKSLVKKARWHDGNDVDITGVWTILKLDINYLWSISERILWLGLQFQYLIFEKLYLIVSRLNIIQNALFNSHQCNFNCLRIPGLTSLVQDLSNIWWNAYKLLLKILCNSFSSIYRFPKTFLDNYYLTRRCQEYWGEMI